LQYIEKWSYGTDENFDHSSPSQAKQTTTIRMMDLPLSSGGTGKVEIAYGG
jgi:hypothetical protein